MRHTALLTTLLLPLLLAIGCATTDAQTSTTETHSAAAVPTPAEPEDELQDTTVEAADEDLADDDTADDEADERAARERTRKRQKLERDLELAQLRFQKAELAAGREIQAQDAAVTQAEQTLHMARQKLEAFHEFEIMLRNGRADQAVLRAEDSLRDARQELEQLELMYSEEQIADKAREIVLDRAKRRVERSEMNLELQKRERLKLSEADLPREAEQLEQDVHQKEIALEQAVQRREATELDNEISVRSARAEVLRLEAELDDLIDAMQRAAADADDED